MRSASLTTLLILLQTWCSVAQDLQCRAPGGQQSFTVYDQEDVDSIASSCSEAVRSTIEIAPSWKGPVDLSSIKNMEGGAYIRADKVPGLTSISAPSLVSLSGKLWLFDCDSLVNISLPVLRDCGGLSLFTSALEQLDIPGTGEPSSVPLDYIVLYNTSITDFSTNLTSSKNTLLRILKNRNLESIDLSSVQTAGAIEIGGNNADVSVNLSNLTRVFNMTLSETKSVLFPQLDTVDGSLSLINTSMTTYDLGQLKHIYNSLIIRDNPKLQSFNISNVALIGTNLSTAYTGTPPAGLFGNLTIVNNPQLRRLNPNTTTATPRFSTTGGKYGLDQLGRVYGNVTIEGPFEFVNLPRLYEVDGYMSVNSTDPSYSCRDFDYRRWSAEEYASLDIKSGNYTCRATSLGSDEDVAEHCCKPRSSSIKAGIAAGVTLGVLLLCAIPLIWYCKRKGVFARVAAKIRGARERRAAKRTEAAAAPVPAHVDAGPVHDDAPPPAYDEIRPAPRPRADAVDEALRDSNKKQAKGTK